MLRLAPAPIAPTGINLSYVIGFLLAVFVVVVVFMSIGTLTRSKKEIRPSVDFGAAVIILILVIAIATSASIWIVASGLVDRLLK